MHLSEFLLNPKHSKLQPTCRVYFLLPSRPIARHAANDQKPFRVIVLHSYKLAARFAQNRTLMKWKKKYIRRSHTPQMAFLRIFFVAYKTFLNAWHFGLGINWTHKNKALTKINIFLIGNSFKVKRACFVESANAETCIKAPNFQLCHSNLFHWRTFAEQSTIQNPDDDDKNLSERKRAIKINFPLTKKNAGIKEKSWVLYAPLPIY